MSDEPIYSIIEVPKASDWYCQVFKDVIFRPTEGGEPNWFHRKMQELTFGVKWIKENDREKEIS